MQARESLDEEVGPLPVRTPVLPGADKVYDELLGFFDDDEEQITVKKEPVSFSFSSNLLLYVCGIGSVI